jgi:hypothetical protein
MDGKILFKDFNTKTSTQRLQWNVFILSYDMKFIVFLKSPSKNMHVIPPCVHITKNVSPLSFLAHHKCIVPCHKLLDGGGLA